METSVPPSVVRNRATTVKSRSNLKSFRACSRVETNRAPVVPVVWGAVSARVTSRPFRQTRTRPGLPGSCSLATSIVCQKGDAASMRGTVNPSARRSSAVADSAEAAYSRCNRALGGSCDTRHSPVPAVITPASSDHEAGRPEASSGTASFGGAAPRTPPTTHKRRRLSRTRIMVANKPSPPPPAKGRFGGSALVPPPRARPAIGAGNAAGRRRGRVREREIFHWSRRGSCLPRVIRRAHRTPRPQATGRRGGGHFPL
jgi:hypothetical protein